MSLEIIKASLKFHFSAITNKVTTPRTPEVKGKLFPRFWFLLKEFAHKAL
jgi:hypothetical protein